MITADNISCRIKYEPKRGPRDYGGSRPPQAIQGKCIRTGKVIRYRSKGAAIKDGWTVSGIVRNMKGEIPEYLGYKWSRDESL